MPGRWDCRLSVPLPDLPSALGWPPASPPPSNNTGNSANSFRQYPASGLLPTNTRRAEVGQRQTEVGAGAAPPCWALLDLQHSVSGSNLRFPPAQNSSMPASPVPLATKHPDWGFCPGSRGSRLRFPPHPH